MEARMMIQCVMVIVIASSRPGSALRALLSLSPRRFVVGVGGVAVTDYLKTDLVLQTFCVRLQTNVSYRTFANHCHGFANKHGNSIDFQA